MLRDLKKLLKSLKPGRHQVILELNTTETAQDLKVCDVLRQTHNVPVKDTTVTLTPTRTVYENFPEVRTPCSFRDSGADSHFTFSEDEKECARNEMVQMEDTVPEYNKLDSDSVHSFAIYSDRAGPRDMEESVSDGFSRFASMTFRKYITNTDKFVENKVQSSAEAYNEYVRLKHARKVIERMIDFYDELHDDHDGTEPVMDICFRHMYDFVSQSMLSLERRYPHLHHYAKKRQTTQSKHIPEDGDEVAEFQFM